MKNTAVLLLFSATLTGCISYEAQLLAPNITFSPEDMVFNQETVEAGAVDFGFQANINESDSLFNVEVLPGVKVRSMEADGPAARAGLQVGDTVLSIANVETNHPDTIAAIQRQPRDSLNYTLRGRRGTVVFEANLQARELPSSSAPIELFRIDPIATRAGFETQLIQINNRNDLVAARITEFFPQSPLPASGFKIGDLVIALDGIELNSAQDLVNRLNQEHALGDEVIVRVFSNNEIKDIPVNLWKPSRRISRISLGPLFNYEAKLSPQSNELSVLDLWLFSLYSYSQIQGEKSHSVLGLIKFSSDLGELVEE
ncbi:MAG: PDZ domain-containing protein [Pseudohongiellaceae bacterium]